ncbi:hypothetical protein [Kordiimonas sp. SCSIO 12610]|uniref:hypothetical protein n=1 Tax=Kordiimonas sp. SCSIO 12610 TaxID=2829597 RepID=UPI002109B3ED|nr:hypothetical protein [Kordiimonas sp. SCSIO 12610]UTW56464.1 hypothetical protein KFF44_06060 [Kordiimonas sp. SCSIO 12610]
MAKQNTSSNFKLVTMILLGAGGLAVLSWQTAAFVAIGLLPSLVLVYTGTGPWKMEKLQCVFLLNAATIIPFAYDIWQNPSSFSYQISNPVSIAGMYSGAAIGYAFIFMGPVFAAAILQILAKDKLRRINQGRKALIDEWGDELTSPDKAKK